MTLRRWIRLVAAAAFAVSGAVVWLATADAGAALDLLSVVYLLLGVAVVTALAVHLLVRGPRPDLEACGTCGAAQRLSVEIDFCHRCGSHDVV